MSIERTTFDVSIHASRTHSNTGDEYMTISARSVGGGHRWVFSLSPAAFANAITGAVSEGKVEVSRRINPSE